MTVTNNYVKALTSFTVFFLLVTTSFNFITIALNFDYQHVKTSKMTSYGVVIMMLFMIMFLRSYAQLFLQKDFPFWSNAAIAVIGSASIVSLSFVHSAVYLNFMLLPFIWLVSTVLLNTSPKGIKHA